MTWLVWGAVAAGTGCAGSAPDRTPEAGAEAEAEAAKARAEAVAIDRFVHETQDGLAQIKKHNVELGKLLLYRLQMRTLDSAPLLASYRTTTAAVAAQIRTVEAWSGPTSPAFRRYQEAVLTWLRLQQELDEGPIHRTINIAESTFEPFTSDYDEAVAVLSQATEREHAKWEAIEEALRELYGEIGPRLPAEK